MVGIQGGQTQRRAEYTSLTRHFGVMSHNLLRKEFHHNSMLRLETAFYQTVSDMGIGNMADYGYINAALQSEAFMAGVAFETIFSKFGIIAHEALSRPYGNGQNYPIQYLANKIYGLGLSEQLDTLTIASALRQARHFPLALNISVETALSGGFWEALMPYIARYDPKDIIFEILEHDVDVFADTCAVEAVRAMGYRFALDDFAEGEDHARRLSVFGDLVDFIKIDGAYLQQMYTYYPEKLKAMVQSLTWEYPHIRLIAEHVKHFDQAEILFAMGFDGVQGRNLRENARK